MEHTIQHRESGSGGAFFIAGAGDGHIAEMTYSRTDPQLVVIDHTGVDPSLQGQGIARRLLDAMVGWARSTGTRVVPVCPYALAQFDNDPSIRDVLA